MSKKNLNTLEMIYIIYCNYFVGFMIDPICAMIVFYTVGNPLDSIFLSGFVYCSIYNIIRIPMIFYYNDV
jgi:hypothetical protein